MKTKIATSLLLSTLLVPFAVHADDATNNQPAASTSTSNTASTSSTTNNTKTVLKDSVITTKVKAELAAQKLSSAIHIKVVTDDKGAVKLSGTANSQADIDKAASIASSVSGVTSVENNIQLSKSAARTAQTQEATSGDQRVEERIKDMHAKLKITPAQEDEWAKVAQVMRDNQKQMDELTKNRAQKTNMSAIDDLTSYEQIADAHADGVKKFSPVFKTLYDDMSAAQKKEADEVFRRGNNNHKAS